MFTHISSVNLKMVNDMMYFDLMLTGENGDSTFLYGSYPYTGTICTPISSFFWSINVHFPAEFMMVKGAKLNKYHLNGSTYILFDPRYSLRFY